MNKFFTKDKAPESLKAEIKRLSYDEIPCLTLVSVDKLKEHFEECDFRLLGTVETMQDIYHGMARYIALMLDKGFIGTDDDFKSHISKQDFSFYLNDFEGYDVYDDACNHYILKSLTFYKRIRTGEIYTIVDIFNETDCESVYNFIIMID